MSEIEAMEVYLLLKGINLLVYESYCECRTKIRRRELADFSMLLGAAMLQARENMAEAIPSREKRLEIAKQIAKDLWRGK